VCSALTVDPTLPAFPACAPPHKLWQAGHLYPHRHTATGDCIPLVFVTSTIGKPSEPIWRAVESYGQPALQSFGCRSIDSLTQHLHSYLSMTTRGAVPRSSPEAISTALSPDRGHVREPCSAAAPSCTMYKPPGRWLALPWLLIVRTAGSSTPMISNDIASARVSRSACR
jgi:hypothetical protein